MGNLRRLVLFSTALALAMSPGNVCAQQFINNGAAHWYTNSATEGVTIGTNTANAPSALTIRGGDMNTPTAEVFRTIVPAGFSSFWKLQRDVNEVGWIFTNFPSFGFRIKAAMDNGGGVVNPGILWLENHEDDGIMIRANDQTGAFTNTVNGFPLGTQGFASVGVRAGGMAAMSSRARWHLVDNNGTVEEPWRPYFRNGVLFSGNNDMGYIGHVYHDASGGTTPWSYTLDRSDLVISAGENDLTDPLRQRIRFTYTTTPGTAGTAGTYNGLEFMQLWPETSTEGFVGIGDFTLAAVNPAERLDVLDRTIRLRGLPTATYQLTGGDWDRVMVVQGLPNQPGSEFCSRRPDVHAMG